MLTSEDINLLLQILDQKIEESENFNDDSLIEFQNLYDKLNKLDMTRYYIFQEISSQKYVVFNNNFDSTIYSNYEIILTDNIKLATKIDSNNNYLNYGNLLSLILKMLKDDIKYTQIFVL